MTFSNEMRNKHWRLTQRIQFPKRSFWKLSITLSLATCEDQTIKFLSVIEHMGKITSTTIFHGRVSPNSWFSSLSWIEFSLSFFFSERCPSQMHLIKKNVAGVCLRCLTPVFTRLFELTAFCCIIFLCHTQTLSGNKYRC